MARGKHEGTWRTLESGNVNVRISIGGKVYSITRPTKRACQKEIARLVQEHNAGLLGGDISQTVGETAEKWLALKRERNAPSTYEGYERVLRLHVLPYLGKVAWKDMDSERLIAMFDELVDKETGRRPVEVAKVAVSGIFRMARKRGLTALNPNDLIELPYKEKRSGVERVWTVEQALKFLEHIQGHWNEYFYTWALLSGMRQGEIIAAEWSDLDERRKALYVNETIYRPRGGGYIFKDVKTKHGRRVIELIDDDLELFEKQRENVEKLKAVAGDRWQEHNLIFPNTIGKPQHRSVICEQFKKLCEGADVPIVEFHNLRHTSASILLSFGVTDFVVSRRLGHSDPSITKKLYGHLLPGTQEEANRVIHGLLRVGFDNVNRYRHQGKTAPLKDDEWMRENIRRPIKEIAKQLGVNVEVAKRHRKEFLEREYGERPEWLSAVDEGLGPFTDPEWWRKNKDRTAQEIADEFGVHVRTVRRYRRKYSDDARMASARAS